MGFGEVEKKKMSRLKQKVTGEAPKFCGQSNISTSFWNHEGENPHKGQKGKKN